VKSSSAWNARSAVISLTATYRRKTWATSRSMRCGTCRDSFFLNTRSATCAPARELSTSSIAADASTTINACLAPLAQLLQGWSLRRLRSVARSCHAILKLSDGPQTFGFRAQGSPIRSTPRLPRVTSISYVARRERVASESSLACKNDTCMCTTCQAGRDVIR
jgi:hypothetical protein